MSVQENQWKDHAQSLIQAVADVAPPGHPRQGSAGSSMHRRLFTQYLAQLEKAKIAGEGWYAGLIGSEEEITGDHDQAVANVRARRPVGPVCHPDVTGTIRSYWLKCVNLNSQVDDSQRVAPEEFLLGWLIGLGHDDLSEFVARYPFWPMGLNFEGKWI